MATDQQRTFAELVCLRASEGGWKVKEYVVEGVHCFSFTDRVADVVTGPAKRDRQLALVGACQRVAPRFSAAAPAQS